MNNRNQILIAAVLIALTFLQWNRNTIDFEYDSTKEPEYTEYSSILWKAHVYPREVVFISSGKVVHRIQFGTTETHQQSATYRNLNGYFDPVFITLWQQGNTYKALIIDPLISETLLAISASSEIDLSVSPDNKIVLTHSHDSDLNNNTQEDVVTMWPAPN